MHFGVITYVLGYASGVLSTLSPCVLPLLPIILGSALAAGRLGPFALTAGVTLSFSAVGIFLATAGAALGLSEAAARDTSAALLLITGVVLMMPVLQRRVAVLVGGASAVGHSLLGRVRLGGSGGQFVVGLMLGAVWSPCVGPTLGAAVALASQGKNLSQVGALMIVYGLGAGTPMLALGFLSRVAAARYRGKLLSIGNMGKYVVGGSLCILGIFALSGFDKTLEAIAVEHSPAWLTDLTTGI